MAVVAVLIVLACAFFAAPVASAETFTVNSVGDQADAATGIGCLTEKEKEDEKEEEECTLRAAIERANGEGESARFEFDESIFAGQASGTIALTSELPAIEVRLLLHGRECLTQAGIEGPCVGIDGLSDEPALSVAHTEEVELEGLAVTGAQTAVAVEGSAHFLAQENWFGVKLDGSLGANGTGISIGPGSDRSLIGSEGAERRNVIAGSADDGLDVHGASNVRILGNYFGVGPDGSTLAPNGKDIEVTSVSEGPAAIGTAIGTRVSFAGAESTPECDGGCNLISGASSSGIDLEGDDPAEAPAVATTITGNYFGLNAAGTAVVPNATSNIHVGAAPQTVVGGPKSGETNRINGGEVGVLAGPEAVDLIVRDNLIGVDSTGTGTLAPPGEGIAVDSGELTTPALEAAIVDNEIRMEGGVAIAQQGFGARISGNEIAGSAIGVEVSKAEEHGNLIEGNLIEGPEVNGILVENALNEIFGNAIFDAGAAGILLRGSLPFRVTENLVGGDVAAEENFVAGSDGAAIEIFNVEQSENEVARNLGSGNGGLFIDLVAASVGKGPNGGIQPPAILAADPTGIDGGGAEAGARVRVFRKQSVEAGELDSFLGEAVADDDGNWAVLYDAAIPVGTRVAATQTSAGGGTSELASATTIGGVEGSGGGRGNGGAGNGTPGDVKRAVDRTRPQTKIVKTSRKRSRSHTAWFKFESNERDTVFLCKLDGKPFDLCGSPRKYKDLKAGRHVFQVRAIDRAGNVDKSPAKTKFTILG